MSMEVLVVGGGVAVLLRAGGWVSMSWLYRTAKGHVDELQAPARTPKMERPPGQRL